MFNKNCTVCGTRTGLFDKCSACNVIDESNPYGIKNIEVPTGNICIINGEKDNKLEFLSIADYGKEKNLKADFLGLTEEINGVPHGDLLPLEEKWVITISSQYGCSMGCTFCDVHKVGPGKNATYYDMINQIKVALSLHPEVKATKRLNIHFARMGEPTFNGNVLDVAACLKRNIYDFCLNSEIKLDGVVHPVVSTMMPKSNKKLLEFLDIWLGDIKNKLYEGEAGLQLSINSTDEIMRKEMFNNNAMSLEQISGMMKVLIEKNGVEGRKITLNFPLCKEYNIDENYLQQLFDPKYFLCKLTPMHITKSCKENNISTIDGYTHFYPYKDTEERLKAAGFDVIVFVPSKEEDESRITCGNAILMTE